MDDKEQTEHFAVELDNLIDRFKAEYEISYAAVIGTMQIKSIMLVNEAAKNRTE